MQRYKLIILVFCLILILLGCSNQEYYEFDKKYNVIYKEIVSALDPNNISESIVDNEINKKLEEIEILVNDIKNEVPKSKKKNFENLMENHQIIKSVIEKGNNWDSINGEDKLRAKLTINTLKSLIGE